MNILPKMILLFFVLLSYTPAAAQEANAAPPQAATEDNERLEIKFAQAPLLEVDLARYVTSDVRQARIFEIPATLAEPLKTDKGVIVLPAQTRLRLKAAVRPGSYFGHPGEVVLWLDPFLIGQGIEGFSCEATAGQPSVPLHPALCNKTWRLSFDHILDYAQTPETGNPLVLVRKKHHEGITGTRNSRPQTFSYDPAGSNVDIRVQTIANRMQATGILYELGTATAGVVRLIFSRRNIFLPTGTRVVFQLENTLRLVPANDSVTRILKFESTQK
ncbi:MAG: hypothetical protein HOP19_09950 [Acidobacteria bacterium]|nr:hypothetical protein [Acidobacteriota bacterium]